MNKRLHKKGEKLIKSELEQASEIVKQIIPDASSLNSIKDKIEISSVYMPANVIGGDLYDYFLIDESHLLVAIGDVSGKGISAALFMSVTHTLLKSNATGKVAKNIVKELNQELFNRNQNQYFVTMFIVVIDLINGTFNYCNAAHTPSLILKDDGTLVELNEIHGLPLGLYINREYKDSTGKLQVGDTLLLITDGITETINNQGVQYGENRLKSEFSSLRKTNPEEIIKYIEVSVKNFRNEMKQIDDYSIIAVRFGPDK